MSYSRSSILLRRICFFVPGITTFIFMIAKLNNPKIEISSLIELSFTFLFVILLIVGNALYNMEKGLPMFNFMAYSSKFKMALGLLITFVIIIGLIGYYFGREMMLH